MRTILKHMAGMRTTFRGTFAKCGHRYGGKHYCSTILLINITTVEGALLTDHVWFDFTRIFERLELRQGDIVEFVATISPYWKKGALRHH